MPDPETDDPLKGEAQAQDEATVMPWFWGGVGVLVIAAFLAWAIFGIGHHGRDPPAAAPTIKSQPY